MPHMDAAMQECIRNCQECHATCLHMATNHCLEMGGKHVEPEHLRLMLACAEICQTSANFMLMGSDLLGVPLRFNLPGSYGRGTWSDRFELPLADLATHSVYGPRIRMAAELARASGRI